MKLRITFSDSSNIDIKRDSVLLAFGGMFDGESFNCGATTSSCEPMFATIDSSQNKLFTALAEFYKYLGNSTYLTVGIEPTIIYNVSSVVSIELL